MSSYALHIRHFRKVRSFYNPYWFVNWTWFFDHFFHLILKRLSPLLHFNNNFFHLLNSIFSLLRSNIEGDFHHDHRIQPQINISGAIYLVVLCLCPYSNHTLFLGHHTHWNNTCRWNHSFLSLSIVCDCDWYYMIDSYFIDSDIYNFQFLQEIVRRL